MSTLEEICRAALPTDPLPPRKERDASIAHAPVRTHHLNESEQKVTRHHSLLHLPLHLSAPSIRSISLLHLPAPFTRFILRSRFAAARRSRPPLPPAAADRLQTPVLELKGQIVLPTALRSFYFIPFFFLIFSLARLLLLANQSSSRAQSITIVHSRLLSSIVDCWTIGFVDGANGASFSFPLLFDTSVALNLIAAHKITQVHSAANTQQVAVRQRQKSPSALKLKFKRFLGIIPCG